MVVSPDIRFIQSLYTPLQPLRKEAACTMDYTEFGPPQDLQPYVYCYWDLRSKAETANTDTRYAIVADGCVDLIFALHDQESVLLSVSGTEAAHFTFSEKVHYMGIRFYPAAIHFFFELSLEGLASRTIDAADILGGQLAGIYDRLFTEPDPVERLLLFNEFLRSRFAERNFSPDNRLLRSMENIFTSTGNASIGKEVADYISPRQQRRLFERYLGLAPKDLSKIIRFQKALSALIRAEKTRTEILHEFGYYDQSHFIRDFRQFYGDTPGNLLI